MAKALPETCLNCGRTISNEMVYCPNCGQKRRKAQLPLKSFISEFFEDYFTVDAKFFRSIGKLIFSPGALTREFNHGKRKSYIAPFRLYIFISFIFFFILAVNHKYDNEFQKGSIIEIGNSDDEQNQAVDSLKMDTTETEDITEKADTSKERSLDINFGGGSTTSKLESFFEERAKRANENPELFVQTLFKAISLTMFIMLPFFGLLLYLFHIRRHKYYVEHLVHSVHVHSFLFVLFLFALLANWIFDWSTYIWIFILAMIYLVLSLRASYNQPYFKSILKAILILPIYIVFITLGLIFVVIGAVVFT